MTPLDIPLDNPEARRYAAQLIRQQRSGPLARPLTPREGWARGQLLQARVRNAIGFYLNNLVEDDPPAHLALLDYIQRKANQAIALDFSRRRSL